MVTPITRRRFISISAAAVGLASFIPSYAATRPHPLYHWQGVSMGADAHIQLACDDKEKAKALTQLCLDEILRLEKIFSLYEPHSVLSLLNRDKSLENPPAELLEVVERSIEIGRMTQGAFDISVQPLWELYQSHFSRDSEQDTSLDEALLSQALESVDYTAISLSPERLGFEKADMAITLNGIAQGYITDRVTELLKRHNMENILVELGETRALGQHPAGRPWKVGIQSPGNPDAIIEQVELLDRAIATSGGYGTVFGKTKHHHLFHPRTGRSSHLYASVSVVASSAMDADALSTAFSMLPMEQLRDIKQTYFSAADVFVLTHSAELIHL